jgi:TP901 family phage tail tape measure protein
MARIDHSLRIAIQAVDRFSGPLSKIQGKLSGMAQTMGRTGKTMTIGVTLPAILAGKAIFDVASKFEASMLNVRALTESRKDQMVELERLAKKLGSTTVFTASEVGEAMGFMAMAGMDRNEILAATLPALNLATAAQVEFSEAADIVTNIMRAYNMEATEMGHVSDVLVAGFTSSNTNLIQMGDAMRYVAPVAEGLGLTLEETVVLIGQLGDAGIQASLAGTSLRGGLARIAKVSEKGKEVFKEYNIAQKDLFDDDGNVKNFISTLELMGKAGIPAAKMLEIFELRAGPAMQVLKGVAGKAALKALKFEGGGVAGRAAEVAAVKMEGAAGATRRFVSAMEGLALSLADSGFLAAMTDFIRSLSDLALRLQAMDPETQAFIMKFAGILAIMGPVLIAMSALFNIIGAIVVVVATIGAPLAVAIAAVIALIANWSVVSKWVDVAGQAIADFARATWDVLKGVGSAITGFFVGIWESVVYGFNKAIDKVKEFAHNTRFALGFEDAKYMSMASPTTGKYAQSGREIPLDGPITPPLRVIFENAPQGTRVLGGGPGIELDLGYSMDGNQ